MTKHIGKDIRYITSWLAGMPAREPAAFPGSINVYAVFNWFNVRGILASFKYNKAV